MTSWYTVRGYPRDWKIVREQILKRAGYRCECAGECGAQHHERHFIADPVLGIVVDKLYCGLADGTFRMRSNGKQGRVVLTIAHLDHHPPNCDDTNLRAWCQPCHLNYDRDLHEERKRLRKQGRSVDPIGDPILCCAQCLVGHHDRCLGDATDCCCLSCDVLSLPRPHR
jgi:hypothetical protein